MIKQFNLDHLKVVNLETMNKPEQGVKSRCRQLRLVHTARGAAAAAQRSGCRGFCTPPDLCLWCASHEATASRQTRWCDRERAPPSAGKCSGQNDSGAPRGVRRQLRAARDVEGPHIYMACGDSDSGCIAQWVTMATDSSEVNHSNSWKLSISC